jgi:hypothetical protein
MDGSCLAIDNEMGALLHRVQTVIGTSCGALGVTKDTLEDLLSLSASSSCAALAFVRMLWRLLES